MPSNCLAGTRARGRKGSIPVNVDADIGLRDSGLTRSVRNNDLHHAVDHAPYWVMFLTGWPVTTLVRGQVMIDAGSRPEEPGFGQLQPRETYLLMTSRNEFPTPFNPRA
jgi:dihydropyrimidinase